MIPPRDGPRQSGRSLVLRRDREPRRTRPVFLLDDRVEGERPAGAAAGQLEGQPESRRKGVWEGRKVISLREDVPIEMAQAAERVDQSRLIADLGVENYASRRCGIEGQLVVASRHDHDRVGQILVGPEDHGRKALRFHHLP